MKRMLKFTLFTLLFFVLILFAAFGWLWYQYYHAPLISSGKPQRIRVAPNTNIEVLTNHLTKRGLLSHPKFFLFINRHNGQSTQLRYGEYWIKPNMSAADLMKNIIEGEGLVRHHITIIEGWTFHQIKTLLKKNKDLQHQLKNKSDREIMQQLGAKRLKPEGLFFPSTYYFLWGNSDFSILQKAYKKMQSFLKKQWRNRKKGLPYHNAYQALIVASLVEKETALKKERPLIAGVILRRLKIGMRLQVDPTVLYGLDKPFDTVITKKDLRKRTPYNTYRIYGLPPTPIDMPSASSIIAALHPAKSKYLYYVAKGDGSHEFSRTYKEHLIAVRRYRNETDIHSEEEVLLHPLHHLYHHHINSRVIKFADFMMHAIYL